MSEPILDRVNKLLHEEKWTRTSIQQYTLSHLKELEELFQEVINSDNVQEVYDLCEEHINTNKNSIVALYLTGMLSLIKQSLDDSNLIKLITIFNQNQKLTLVEHLCLSILSHGEHKFALKTLVDIYRQEGNEEKSLEFEERLAKVDVEDPEVVYSLAQKYEKSQNIQKAIEFYKKALHRFLQKKIFNRLQEVWKILLKLSPKEHEYFMQIENKVYRTLDWGSSKSLVLLKDYYSTVIKNSQNFDQAIEILLRINNLELEASAEKESGQQKDGLNARKEIIEVLKNKHADNPKVEEYIRMSGIQQSFRNLEDAMREFYKHLNFAKGNFVYHNTWGVGRIKEILDKEQEFIIDFEKKRDHKMAQKMAVDVLQVLNKDDIRVIIATTRKEEMKKKVKENVEWTLKTILKSFGNKADFKTIRSILTPSVLDNSEWSIWSTAARKVLKKSPDFAFDPERPDTYLLRLQPISYEEKAFNKFRGEKDFYKKVDVFLEILDEDLVNTDYFIEIFNHFANYLRASRVNHEVISSYLLLQMLVQKYPYFTIPNTKTFADLIQEIESFDEMYLEIKNQILRNLFVLHIKKSVKNWPEIYMQIFLANPSKNLIEELLGNGRKAEVQSLFKIILERFREQKEAMIWLARYLHENNLWSHYNITRERVVICLLNILEIVGREIANTKDVPTSKKVKKTIMSLLFKEKLIDDLVKEIDYDTATRLYTLIGDMKEVPPNEAQQIRNLLQAKFGSFVSKEEAAVATYAAKKGLLTTRSMYNKKSKELSYLVEVEIPKNSKEIGDAMALGDLKENAEYHAAKERQSLLNATVSQLSRELETAVVVDLENVDPSKIGFGTRVTLRNLLDGSTEVYTILGPWESAPEKNIISYLSPLGEKMLGHAVGDTLKFTINDRQFSFEVQKIERAEFEP